ncbi:MAG: cytochrome c [Pirellulaceae bacterium]|nr:MAG: cytochrome c [Pirellulaceae bacterium]
MSGVGNPEGIGSQGRVPAPIAGGSAEVRIGGLGRLPVRRFVAVLVGIVLLASFGCGAPVAEFRTNELYLIHQEFKSEPLPASKRRELQQNLKDLMVALFGTPDEPYFPEVEGVDIRRVCDPVKLQMAAGPVRLERSGAPRGLYREHCAHCHGITGDGRGPTAEFLNPYPRDYRRGLYKFKSTPAAEPPTHEDLQRILINGIPGTAMPSFRLLPEQDREALIHYVRYLSIRGQVERTLLEATFQTGDLDLTEISLEQLKAPENIEFVKSVVADIVTRWAQADYQATPVPPPPENFESAESIRRGRELFYGPIANCVKCHGETALGDGQTTDYDEWTKELMPNEPDKVARFLATGAALPPRNIRPRNLRLNVFRGGRRPVDLYWRIRNGILASGMPAASMKPDDAPPDDPRLTSDDIWHLVAYVRSLPYDDLSAPQHLPVYQRERQ